MLFIELNSHLYVPHTIFAAHFSNANTLLKLIKAHQNGCKLCTSVGIILKYRPTIKAEYNEITVLFIANNQCSLLTISVHYSRKPHFILKTLLH